MTPSATTSDARVTRADWDQQLSELLRAEGHRVTSQRLVLYRALREQDRHITAEELLTLVAASLPGLSLPTVYATLDLFDELGLVRRLATSRGAVRFDSRTDPHHHTVCRECGRVEDLVATVKLAPAIAAARRAGFDTEGAELLVSGWCAECAAREIRNRAQA
jgi:Fe2+ or Zn2+ uptake regulation protein